MSDPSLRRCHDPDQRGFTLVEVMVAIMISAMMVTSFFSIALTSRVQTIRSDHKFAANQQVQRLLQKLKNTTAPWKDSISGTADASYYSSGWMSLPNAGKLAQDTANTWAMATGTVHDVTSMLMDDPTFYDAASASWHVDNASLQYCVADPGAMYACGAVFGNDACPGGGFEGKCVKVIITWDERKA